MAESTNLLERILSSIFFRKAQKEARRSARNPIFLFQLISKVMATGTSKGIVSEAQEKLGLLTRLIRAYASGEYRVLPWKSVVLTVGVLIYFVNPIDLIIDVLPIIGFTDDLALVFWLYKTISSDLDDFREWEKAQAISLDTE